MQSDVSVCVHLHLSDNHLCSYVALVANSAYDNANQVFRDTHEVRHDFESFSILKEAFRSF